METVGKLEWHNEKRRVKDLIPFEKNPRKLTDSQAKELKKSIERFNLVEIPAINLDGKIVAGHQRLKIMSLLGREQEEIDVRVPNRPLTEEEFSEYCLRSNKNTGEWDLEALAGFEKDMLLDIGFSPEELDGIFKIEDLGMKGDPDSIPEPPTEPVSKRGDLYLLGQHRLLCGDSTLISDIQKLLDGAKADMVFTDPPYNLNYDLNNSGMVQSGQQKARFGKILNDNMSNEDFDKFIYDVFTNLLLAMEEGASFYICGGRESTQVFNRILEQAEFHIAQWIIWVKEHFNMSRLSYHPQHEVITYGWKTGKPHRWFAGRSESDVWKFERNIGKSVHPTEKPVELIEYAIKNSSLQGDRILDLFGGSGSTLMACEKTNRRCFTMELDPVYCDVIVKRYEDLTGKKPTRVEANESY